MCPGRRIPKISTKSDPGIRAILMHMNNKDPVIQMHVSLIIISLISFISKSKTESSLTYTVYVLVIASLILRQHSNNCSSSSPPSHNALSHSAIANAAYALGIAGIVAIGIRVSCNCRSADCIACWDYQVLHDDKVELCFKRQEATTKGLGMSPNAKV